MVPGPQTRSNLNFSVGDVNVTNLAIVPSATTEQGVQFVFGFDLASIRIRNDGIEMRAGKNAPRTFHEKFQKPEFGGTEMQITRAAFDTVCFAVK